MCFWKKKKVAEEPAKPVEVKEEPKKEEPVKEEPKAEAPAKKPAKKPAAKPAKEEKKEDPTKVYHVSKRAEDGKWSIKFANGKKVIKLFDTKAEAVEYAEKVADNQEGIVLTHASKGKKAGKINEKL